METVGHLIALIEGVAVAVPPSGGSLEIGNPTWVRITTGARRRAVPPSGGSLEIGNNASTSSADCRNSKVPPSGGSLEIGNFEKWAALTSIPF